MKMSLLPILKWEVWKMTQFMIRENFSKFFLKEHEQFTESFQIGIPNM